MKFDLNSLNFDWARNIYGDLKNKHLLPVAALLLAALIVVPFVLGRGGDEPAPVPAASATAADQPSEAKLDPIAVKESRPNGQDVGGTPSNPFQQPGQPKSSASSVAASTPSDSSTGTSGSTGTSTTEAPSPAKTSNDPSSAYKLDIKFGTPGATDSKKNVLALAPFPSADNAYIVYLGAIDNGKTAVFLVSTDVTATGDGICDPSETNCKTVELQAGDTETFKVKDDASTGIFAEYELKIVKIHK